VDFTGDMLPSFYICGQKNNGMSTITNGAISHHKLVFEQLRAMSEKHRTRGRQKRKNELTSYLDFLALELTEGVRWAPVVRIYQQGILEPYVRVPSDSDRISIFEQSRWGKRRPLSDELAIHSSPIRGSTITHEYQWRVVILLIDDDREDFQLAPRNHKVCKCDMVSGLISANEDSLVWGN
jgi:hypothetical protein